MAEAAEESLAETDEISEDDTGVEETADTVSQVDSNEDRSGDDEERLESDGAVAAAQEAESNVAENEAVATDAAAAEEQLPFLEPTEYTGVQKNPVVAIAITLAGVMSFSMGMTNTFFAEASAWTFIVWGLLLFSSNLLDNYQRYELNNDGIIIRNPIRFWYPRKSWDWNDIYRLDILVGRRDTQYEDADMHIYHELSGELIKDREDRKLNPKMAQTIIERANLIPVGEGSPSTIYDVPLNQREKYHWTKTGSLA